MQISVLIPTRGRADKLARCLQGLAQQSFPADQFEVVVGFDGPDPHARAAANQAWTSAGGDAANLRIIECPNQGYTLVRNRILTHARAGLILNINDDILPSPDLLRVHLQAHEQRRADAQPPAIVVGHSPYRRHDPETLTNKLVRLTSMVFFYDVMIANADDTQRDWGFRHCFGLNFSAPADRIREVGGFMARPHLYGYDDIELGFKLQQRYSSPVLFRPDAFAEHDHAYIAADLIEREHKLGIAAWTFAEANPAFALACFGRDLRSDDELGYSRSFVTREAKDAERLREAFLTFDDIPGDAVSGPHEADLLRALANQFVLLKRWTWRQGLLEAAGR